MSKILNSKLEFLIFFKINFGKLPSPKINIIYSFYNLAYNKIYQNDCVETLKALK